MSALSVERVVKNSVLYGYALSQPFAMYMDMFPMVQNNLALEADTLQYGDNSELVGQIQHSLNHLGFYDDDIDGVFGLLTEHALKRFQSAHQIDITGTVDEQTMITLIENEIKNKLKKIQPLINNMTDNSPTKDIVNVQEVLQDIGYYKGKIDGIYGPLTADAIQQVKIEYMSPPPSPQSKVEENIVTNDANQTVKKADENKQAIKPVQTNSGQLNHTQVIQTAKTYIGTPYVWGGTSPQHGFDCSGFIQFLYSENGKNIPRTVSDIWNFSSSIDSPSIGDLVFFETYKAGPSHLGIYLGNGQFIHAGMTNGVEISNLNYNYWKNRYIGSKRIY